MFSVEFFSLTYSMAVLCFVKHSLWSLSRQFKKVIVTTLDLADILTFYPMYTTQSYVFFSVIHMLNRIWMLANLIIGSSQTNMTTYDCSISRGFFCILHCLQTSDYPFCYWLFKNKNKKVTERLKLTSPDLETKSAFPSFYTPHVSFLDQYSLV